MEFCQLKDHSAFFRQDKTRQAALLLVHILLNMMYCCEYCLVVVILRFVVVIMVVGCFDLHVWRMYVCVSRAVYRGNSGMPCVNY